jgi:enoyl-CoA hydratase/carnithine racemase
MRWTEIFSCLGYHRAAEIALTGRTVTAEEGKQLGFVNEITTSMFLFLFSFLFTA